MAVVVGVAQDANNHQGSPQCGAVGWTWEKTVPQDDYSHSLVLLRATRTNPRNATPLPRLEKLQAPTARR